MARRRHAELRREAYGAARADAIRVGGIDPRLRIADIGEAALDRWRSTWGARRHPSGAGGWDWPRLVSAMPRKAAVLPIAIWFGTDLCGLALGYASRSRGTQGRGRVTLTFIERRPVPPAVPLAGRVIPLTVSVALNYGAALGARRLVLLDPDSRLLGYYELLGFTVVRRGGKPVSCIREI